MKKSNKRDLLGKMTLSEPENVGTYILLVRQMIFSEEGRGLEQKMRIPGTGTVRNLHY